VTGEVRDVSGGGGNTRKLEVLMSIEELHVTLDSVSPTPHKPAENVDGFIQLWWRLDVKPNDSLKLEVVLACKPEAHGPTQVGLAACSRAGTLPADERFYACTSTIYHGHQCPTLSA
jgi:hypothetical protein